MTQENKALIFTVTGDIHGNVSDLNDFSTEYDPKTHALIILGDAGFNFYLNKTDKKNKQYVQNLGFLVYCVRGNHEERPKNIPTMTLIYDDNVKGKVWYEEDYSNIRYFQDGVIYKLGAFSALVIGGAYSVDKYYRLSKAIERGIDPNTGWTGWFPEEQLTLIEKQEIEDKVDGRTFDFVLTHTCPYSWQPFDLFLPQVDQKTVDNTTERWMDELKNKIHWRYAWLFGHFHKDRIVRPHVEMYMDYFETLDEIAERWKAWDNGYQLDWWLRANLDPCWEFWEEEMNKRKVKDNQFILDSDIDDDDEDWRDEEFLD